MSTKLYRNYLLYLYKHQIFWNNETTVIKKKKKCVRIKTLRQCQGKCDSHFQSAYCLKNKRNTSFQVRSPASQRKFVPMRTCTFYFFQNL